MSSMFRYSILTTYSPYMVYVFGGVFMFKFNFFIHIQMADLESDFINQK